MRPFGPHAPPFGKQPKFRAEVKDNSIGCNNS